MDKENNTNLGGNNENQNTGSAQSTNQTSSNFGRTNFSGSSSPENSSPKPITSSKKSKKMSAKLLFVLVVFILSIGAGTAGGYYLGKGKKEVAQPAVATPKPISLPPEAIVTAECVPGRGKQYIIPKDIPQGPIYDVNGDKVIAIEYSVSIGELLYSQSSTFSDLILSLTKEYPVDHFSVIPEQSTSADLAAQQVHLIMFVVSKDESNSITCGIDPAVLKQQAEEAQKALQAQQAKQTP